MSTMRLLVSLLVGKLILFVTRSLKVGGGSAAPGFYALKIYPNLVTKLAAQIPQNIVITGTNGKTTTARLLYHFLASQNLKLIKNSTGSNLERGVASSLLSSTSFFGKVSHVDMGIWELDEAAFSKTVFQIKPRLVVFLNAFRDQLDRYGEVDTIVSKWEDALRKTNWPMEIIINGNDGSLTRLSKIKNITTDIFTVKDAKLKWEKPSDINVSLFKKRLEASNVVQKGLTGNSFKITQQLTSHQINLPLPGVYHVFDFLAALLAYIHLNFPISMALEALKDFSPAFGRVEEIKIKLKQAYIFLIKNPAGATAVFETINPEIKPADRILVALNDNLADGTDISWIWDAEFETLINGQDCQIICSGKRALDLALRLKYSGVIPDKLQIEPDIAGALDLALRGLGGRLFILPTYTALLELQKLLVRQGAKNFYWQES